MADYYSTATVHRDRRHVLLGAPVPTHLAQLSRAFVPVEQLVSTARTAKIWDTEAGHTFYAESWALVHYLVRGTPARGARGSPGSSSGWRRARMKRLPSNAR